MKKAELLLPAGSLVKLKTAILYGADAVYAGTPDMSLRTQSKFTLEDLKEGIDFDIYSGNDDQVIPILSLGGIGVISVLSNIAPKETHDIVAKYLAGDVKGSLELQLKYLPLIDALFSEVNPIPVKKACEFMGMHVGNLRMPLTEMSPEKAAVLEKEMKKVGLL